MYYPVLQAIKDKLEAQAVAGGLLPTVETVEVGLRMFTHDEYPLIMVMPGDSIEVESGHRQLKMDFEIMLVVQALTATATEAYAAVSGILFDDSGTPTTGLYPLLAEDGSVTVNGGKRMIRVGDRAQHSDGAEEDYYVAQAVIPVKVKHWVSL